VISVDLIEDAMLRAGITRSAESGVAAYEIGAALAAQQLSLGHSVIGDAANYLEVGRDIWHRAAHATSAPVRVVHLGCRPAIRLHDARHTAATVMLRAGVPVKVVWQRLGHADVAVTMRVYQHVTAQDDRAAADALGRAFAREP
jgi:integrase